MIQAALEASGARVSTAYNADDAVALAGKQKFDVILSDLAMPGGDGFSLLRRLRLRGDRTPAIALSSLRGPDVEKEVRDAGFVQHLDKPIEILYLTSAVADVVYTAREAKAARRTG
jgi:CheY-like chemotaxis protein